MRCVKLHLYGLDTLLFSLSLYLLIFVLSHSAGGLCKCSAVFRSPTDQCGLQTLSQTVADKQQHLKVFVRICNLYKVCVGGGVPLCVSHSFYFFHHSHTLYYSSDIEGDECRMSVLLYQLPHSTNNTL